jgi:lipoate-protein ligase A
MFLKEVRFIPFSLYSPYENMAIDEYLINYYILKKKPVLRLYSWNPAGISIGKNQNINTINLNACLKDSIPVVRRMTGGGAIFHGKELTYCLVCSENDISDKKLSVKESFELLNSFLLQMYEKLGLKAQYAKYINKTGTPSERAPHCFSDNEEYDIIINNKKIGGNAQYRRKKIIFQHGSIPIEKNITQAKYFCDEIIDKNFSDLNELLGRKINRKEVKINLIKAFIEKFDVDLKKQSFNRSEKKQIAKILSLKYMGNKWNLKGEL